MKILPAGIRLVKPIKPTASQPVATKILPFEARTAQPVCDDGLMPYERVAKAIFVKANGLPAYRKTTGTHPSAALAGEPEKG